MADRAAEEVARLLKTRPAARAEEGLLRELRKIMLADARNNGVAKLPEIKK